jgi:hypothetical protein
VPQKVLGFVTVNVTKRFIVLSVFSVSQEMAFARFENAIVQNVKMLINRNLLMKPEFGFG